MIPFFILVSVEGEDFIVVLDRLVTFSNESQNGDSLCIQVQIIDDDIYEEYQQFSVSVALLSPPISSDVGIGEVDKILYKIQDNASKL